MSLFVLASAAVVVRCHHRLRSGCEQEIFASYGKVTTVDLAVDKRVNLPKVRRTGEVERDDRVLQAHIICAFLSLAEGRVNKGKSRRLLRRFSALCRANSVHRYRLVWSSCTLDSKWGSLVRRRWSISDCSLFTYMEVSGDERVRSGLAV